MSYFRCHLEGCLPHVPRTSRNIDIIEAESESSLHFEHVCGEGSPPTNFAGIIVGGAKALRWLGPDGLRDVSEAVDSGTVAAICRNHSIPKGTKRKRIDDVHYLIADSLGNVYTTSIDLTESTIAGLCRVVSAFDCGATRGQLPPIGSGSGGWVGIDTLGDASFIVGREHFRDVRVVSSNFVRHVSLSRAPSSLCALSQSSFAVAAGTSIHVYESGSDAVVKVHSIHARFPFWTVASLRGDGLLWAAGSDRSVTVYDQSKAFSKTQSSQNVLKYDSVNLSVVKTNTTAVVLVSGLDYEVRQVAPGKTEDKVEASGNTFRGRLDSAIHGDDAWFGSWIPLQGAGSFGLSQSGTLYYASAE